MDKRQRNSCSGSADDASQVMDRQSFAAQYHAAYSRLWQIATGMIGDRAHAEDIVQEAAVIALKKVHSYDPNASFAAWMAAIVRRCSLNYIRKLRNRATVPTDPVVLDQSGFTTQATSLPSEVVNERGMLHESQSEFDDHVLRGLRSLTDVARCCLLLRVVQQLSYAEISELMQISAGTAMSHVHRSKQVLRHHMQSVDSSNQES